MKHQGELSIVGACGGYSKTPAKHAPAVGNSVLNSPINNLGSGSNRLRASKGFQMQTRMRLFCKHLEGLSRILNTAVIRLPRYESA
jgi:hypothetical protein